METVIKVGIADLNIVRPPNTIRTTGLGSCVGVILYDSTEQLAGLAHIMLPDSKIAKNSQMINKAKFADTAINELKSKLIKEGSKPYRLKAKIAGGAEMFSFSSSNETMRIGPRNVAAVKLALQKENIQIVAEDTGGNSGRTIEFDPVTSILHIRTVNQGKKDI
ncbi:chemotaxis protein CheD [Heyndrickxia sp. NPDC080065]|uniref:chemotaxis protein CheD n=1 Tax=Heyndrickxia sp. NPDC080065 TaxID=3390568 RepID=UPI003CFD5C95